MSKYLPELNFNITETRLSAYKPDMFGRIYKKHYSFIIELPEILTPLIERILSKKKQKKKIDFSYKSTAFNSFFCVALGKKITNSEEMKEIDKRGLVAMTQDEIKREASKYKRWKKEEHRAKIRKKAEQALREINQGRSFYKEMINQGIPREAVHKAMNRVMNKK